MSMNRFEQVARERQEVAERLAAEHLPGIPVHITDRVFSFAYEEGHASGWGEVENYYVEIAPIVIAAFNAGKGLDA